jgi:hypothetical protein
LFRYSSFTSDKDGGGVERKRWVQLHRSFNLLNTVFLIGSDFTRSLIEGSDRFDIPFPSQPFWHTSNVIRCLYVHRIRNYAKQPIRSKLTTVIKGLCFQALSSSHPYKY